MNRLTVLFVAAILALVACGNTATAPAQVPTAVPTTPPPTATPEPPSPTPALPTATATPDRQAADTKEMQDHLGAANSFMTAKNYPAAIEEYDMVLLDATLQSAILPADKAAMKAAAEIGERQARIALGLAKPEATPLPFPNFVGGHLACLTRALFESMSRAGMDDPSAGSSLFRLTGGTCLMPFPGVKVTVFGAEGPTLHVQAYQPSEGKNIELWTSPSAIQGWP